MMRPLLIILLVFLTQSSFSRKPLNVGARQPCSSACSVKLANGPVKDSVHIDSVNGFKITVPEWWQIRETPPDMFGGTFPALDSVENALVFKCFRKEKFKDLEAFENWVVKGYSIGQAPAWSSQHKMLLKKEITGFNELGRSYKVQLLRGGKIYDCCYIVTETSSAFVWIDFTATSTTYPKNFDKFREIVTRFEKL